MSGNASPEMITCADLIEAATAIEAWIGRIRDILEQSSDVIPPLKSGDGTGMKPWLNQGCRYLTEPSEADA